MRVGTIGPSGKRKSSEYRGVLRKPNADAKQAATERANKNRAQEDRNEAAFVAKRAKPAPPATGTLVRCRLTGELVPVKPLPASSTGELTRFQRLSRVGTAEKEMPELYAHYGDISGQPMPELEALYARTGTT